MADEISAIGGTDVQLLTRAVRYRGDQALLYKSNYMLRTALKVLKPIATFKIFNDHQLYRHVKRIPWEDFLGPDDTFAIHAVTNSDIFRHSKYIALKSKDALVDRLRDLHGARPSVDTRNPDLQIHVHIDDKLCSVALDSSGATLARRGYKTDITEAPMSEVLAAGIVLLSGWDGNSPFIDPMCGSGTLAIEAALIAHNVPPGSWRGFGFEKWRDFDPELWDAVREEARPVELLKGLIRCSDINPKAVAIARANARRAHVEEAIIFDTEDFLLSEAKASGGVLIMNPPYGERLENQEDIAAFYGDIGTRLKHHYAGRSALILSSNLDALKKVGLRTSRRHKLFNGPLECRLYHYVLYDGSKKGR